MDRILDKNGFGAVGVDGLVPALAFMGFQKYGVTPISTDMRINIAYTPSPDIVHEGLGHMAMLSNPEYRGVLKKLGEIGMKVRFSPEDTANYEAVRRHCILAETPGVSKSELDEAFKKVLSTDELAHLKDSEARRLQALYWWTVEYGLIKINGSDRIFGAGLISSLSEGRDYMKKPHLQLSLTTSEARYDITKPQPHYFVAESFGHILDVLEEFRKSIPTSRKSSDLDKIPKSETRVPKKRISPKDKQLD